MLIGWSPWIDELVEAGTRVALVFGFTDSSASGAVALKGRPSSAEGARPARPAAVFGEDTGRGPSLEGLAAPDGFLIHCWTLPTINKDTCHFGPLPYRIIDSGRSIFELKSHKET